ncbi:hypothetical protein D9757_000650 [Collybiopsis confluens]|uniref:Uncharacterized protein n=1 Tax=Collybiopsis confluens TaxID=2823264 RepID=A0A8H5I1M4_9AGAR|nr:hypothetical protein D9757_000650 [Collybiopsis confluens]
MKELRPDPPFSHSSRKPRPLFHTADRSKPRSTSQPPPHAQVHSNPPVVPWQHMANTYAWVMEQEFVKVDRKNRTTEEWIFETKVPSSDAQERARRRMWEDATMEAEKWMKHEEELRRIAAERERQKAKVFQEELRRYEARMREKREAEKQWSRGVSENRYRAQQAAREREHRGRARAEKSILDAWDKYEKEWTYLLSSSEPLGFSDIPWPVLQNSLAKPEDITPAGISAFLLSPLHSQSSSPRERIRGAQLRWHPDRFQRLMARVKAEDKEAVGDGVGIVARCLNDIMAREKSLHRH